MLFIIIHFIYLIIVLSHYIIHNVNIIQQQKQILLFINQSQQQQLYIQLNNITLNEKFETRDILKLLANSTEFSNIQTHKDEIEELEQIRQNAVLVNVEKDTLLLAESKVLLLIETYLYQERFQAYSLATDMNYVVQNMVRLMRGMTEIAICKRLYSTATNCLEWTIRLEKRLLEGHHFLRQFAPLRNVSQQGGLISEELLMILEDKKTIVSINKLFIDEDLEQIKKDLDCLPYYDELIRFSEIFPFVDITVNPGVKSRNILQFNITLFPSFRWMRKWHGRKISYKLLLDVDGAIIHSQIISLTPQDCENGKLQLTISLKMEGEIPKGLFASIISENWLEAKSTCYINLEFLMKTKKSESKSLECNEKFPISILQEGNHEKLFSEFIDCFSFSQSASLPLLYKSDNNALICNWKDRDILMILAILRTLKAYLFLSSGKRYIIVIFNEKTMAERMQCKWEIPLKQHCSINMKYITDFVNYTKLPEVILTNIKSFVQAPDEFKQLARDVIIYGMHWLLSPDYSTLLECLLVDLQSLRKCRKIGLSLPLENPSFIAECLEVSSSNIINCTNNDKLNIKQVSFSDKYIKNRTALALPYIKSIVEKNEGKILKKNGKRSMNR